MQPFEKQGFVGLEKSSPDFSAPQSDSASSSESEASLEEALKWDGEAFARLIGMLDALPVEEEFKKQLQERLSEMLEVDQKAGEGLEYIKLQELGQADVKPAQDSRWAEALLSAAEDLFEHILVKGDLEARREILLCADRLAQEARRFFDPVLNPEKARQVSIVLDKINAELQNILPGDKEPDL
jgi:predicted TPR repeat methyltransferase